MCFAKKTIRESFVGPVLKFFGRFYNIVIPLYVFFKIITAAMGVANTSRGAITLDIRASFGEKGIVFL